MCLGGIFDYDLKKERLAEVELDLGEPSVWDKPERAQALGRERAALEMVVKTIDDLDNGVRDSRELLDMAVEEDDESMVADVQAELERLDKQLGVLEFRRMFSGETDANNAYLDIQSGSGGTEAQDWAEIVLRMYLRWGEAKGFKVTLEEVSAGDVAGINRQVQRFLGDRRRVQQDGIHLDTLLATRELHSVRDSVQRGAFSQSRGHFASDTAQVAHVLPNRNSLGAACNAVDRCQVTVLSANWNAGHALCCQSSNNA